MKRRLMLAAALVFVPGASAASSERAVTIPGKLFTPERLEVLIGDTVTWTNLDSATHDITADDGSFESGDLESDESFSLTFSRPGTITYHCSIHRYMTGEIDVHGIALSGPLDTIRAGASFELRGLAPPQSGTVAIERRVGTGLFAVMATRPVGSDGSFRVSIPAEQSADYRAVAGALVSAIVRATVGARVTLAIADTAPVTRLRVTTSPAQPGAAVELQTYVKERFAWRRVAHRRLDSASQARFSLRPARKMHVRVVVVRGVGGYGPSVSNSLVVSPPAR